MQVAAVAFVALMTAAVLVLTRRWHGQWTGDFQGSGVQKMHLGAPPRVGILALLAALLAGWIILNNHPDATSQQTAHTLVLMLLASLPVTLLGLADDLCKKISPRARLMGALSAAVLAMALLGTQINRIDIPGVDMLVAWAPVAAVLTMLMVSGFTNAINIVDGLNGLASGLSLLMLVATGFVAWQLQDTLLLNLCALLGAAVLGFMCINFPRGLMFLGDGGAYLIGFLLAQIWILLAIRHPDVSVWFALAVGAHPTMETIFSIYRRYIKRNRRHISAMTADRLHLHSLVYRRRTLRLWGAQGPQRWRANAAASALVIGFAAVPAILATLNPHSALWNMMVVAGYVAAYLLWFKRLTAKQPSHRAGPSPGATPSRPTQVAHNTPPARLADR